MATVGFCKSGLCEMRRSSWQWPGANSVPRLRRFPVPGHVTPSRVEPHGSSRLPEFPLLFQLLQSRLLPWAERTAPLDLLLKLGQVTFVDQRLIVQIQAGLRCQGKSLGVQVFSPHRFCGVLLSGRVELGKRLIPVDVRICLAE